MTAEQQAELARMLDKTPPAGLHGGAGERGLGCGGENLVSGLAVWT